jgi:hypothetical protein
VELFWFEGISGGILKNNVGFWAKNWGQCHTVGTGDGKNGECALHGGCFGLGFCGEK